MHRITLMTCTGTGTTDYSGTGGSVAYPTINQIALCRRLLNEHGDRLSPAERRTVNAALSRKRLSWADLLDIALLEAKAG